MPNRLGSLVALSLATPEAIIPLATAGAAITIAAATFIYTSYTHYEDKKHKEIMELINTLHTKHLEKIEVIGLGVIRGFPPIFKLSADKDSSSAESMHMTEDEVANVSTTLSHETDTCLSKYREDVLSAILKLQEYYNLRKPKRRNTADITSSVIIYLLYMLETKCLNFSGYVYDIAYLDALSNFVNAYASIKGKENSQHFTYMQPVYTYLSSAKQALEQHQESLSLEEFFTELRDSSMNVYNKLSRLFIKLLIKPEHFEFSQTVAHDELRMGILSRKYVQSEVFGIALRTHDEIQLPDSVFKTWIMTLANYYLQALSPDVNLDQERILLPQKLFDFPGDSDKELNKKIKKELNKIREIFNNSPNIVTTELDLSHKPPKYIPITDDTKLLERTNVLANYSKLLHELISLQYLCAHILKNIKQLGEIYVRNPHHFQKIFQILNGLLNLIQKTTEGNRDSFTHINQENNNVMRLEIEELLPKEIQAQFNLILLTIMQSREAFNKYRTKLADRCKTTTAKSANYEILAVAANLMKMYPEIPFQDNLEVFNHDEQPVNQAHGAISTVDAIIPPIADQESTPMILPVNQKLTIANELLATIHQQIIVISQPPQNAQPMFIQQLTALNEVLTKATHFIAMYPLIPQGLEQTTQDTQLISAAVNNVPKDRVVHVPFKNPKVAILDELLSKISQQISVISTGLIDTKKVTAYKNILQSLIVMQKKAKALIKEQGKSQERQNKADQTLELTCSLSTKTLDFLMKSSTDRQAQSASITKTIHDEISNDDNGSFIDLHYNELSKFLCTYLGNFGIFRTDTRKKLADLEEQFMTMNVS